MPIVILILSTALAVIWLILLGRVNRDDWIAAAYNKVLECTATIEKLHRKDMQMSEKMSGYSGFALSVMKIFNRGGSKKKIEKLEQDSKGLIGGNLKSVNVFVMPGYVLQREFPAIGKGTAHKSILAKCYELHGKKNATYKAKHLLAKMLSYPIIGVAATLALGASILGIGNNSVGVAILAIGSILVLVLVYAMYDELGDLVRKRHAAISKQFPNVVSKLALLLTSGMIMDRAWKLTANSRDDELYLEMRKTSEELDNLVSPEAAYSGFINRCNTKETAKLASAIMQNLSKGNTEIGRLLVSMAREAWQERRHTAKRDAEKANSKLMIPTMLLFIAILVMLMMPIAMNFSSI